MIMLLGNAAWAHLRAKDELLVTSPGGGIAGLPIFITDDTPVDDLLIFAQKVTTRSDLPPRCCLSRWYIPALLAYMIAGLLEAVVLIARIPLPFPPRGTVAYLGSIVLYSRLRASLHLDYTPVFPSDESHSRANKYYIKEKLWQCVSLNMHVFSCLWWYNLRKKYCVQFSMVTMVKVASDDNALHNFQCCKLMTDSNRTYVL